MKFFLISMLVMIIKASTINGRTQPPEVSVVSSQEGTTAVTTTKTSSTTSGPKTQSPDSTTQTTPVSGSSPAETVTVQVHAKQLVSETQNNQAPAQPPQVNILPNSEQQPASQTTVGSHQQEIAINKRSSQSLNGSTKDIPTVQPSTSIQRQQQQADLANKGSREETRSNVSPSNPQMPIIKDLSQGDVRTTFIDKPQSDQRELTHPPVRTNQQTKVIGQSSSQGSIVSERPNQKENKIPVAAKKVTKAVKKSKDEKSKSSREKSKKSRSKRSTKSHSENENAKSSKTTKSKSKSSDKKKKSGKSKKSRSKDAEKKPKSVKLKKSNAL